MKIAQIVLFSLILLGVGGCSQTSPDAHHLYRGNAAEPESLDPQLVHTLPGINIDNDLFDGLVGRNPQGDIIPAQAESWKVSDNGKVWTFQLRQSKWSNGQPVTAHDFVFAWQRAVNPKTGGSYGWYLALAGVLNADAIIKGERPPADLGIKALGDEKLQVTLAHPVPWFLNMLPHPVLFPVPEKVVEKYGERWTRPDHMVSNGSYKLSAWVPNERITLAINPYHPGSQKLDIHEVTYLPLTSASAELHRYQAGELDITNGIPTDYFRKLEKTTPEQIHFSHQLGTEYYAFNTKEAPFNNPILRRALSLAIDRKVLVDDVTGTGELPAYSFLPSYISEAPKYTPHYATLSRAERIAEAKKLYSEAGFSSSHPLKLTLLYNTSESRKKIAIAIATMWQQNLGVQTQLENMEMKTMVDKIASGQFDIARASWVSDFNEASDMLAIFSSHHSSNKSRYDNPAYDQLVATAVATLSPEKRTALYLKMEQVLNRDMPVIPLYHYASARLVSPRVEGYYASPQDQVLTRYLSLKPTTKQK